MWKLMEGKGQFDKVRLCRSTWCHLISGVKVVILFLSRSAEIRKLILCLLFKKLPSVKTVLVIEWRILGWCTLNYFTIQKKVVIQKRDKTLVFGESG